MEQYLNSLMESLPLFDSFGFGVLIPLICFALVGVLAQWSLYDKCGLPGIDCIIPVKNVITFLKIVGRPASHSLLVMIPPPLILGALIGIPDTMISYSVAGVLGAVWAVFMIKVYIELCQSFGHYRMIDYILVTIFNGFYVLHLGLSYTEEYEGPVYGKVKEKAQDNLEGQLA